MTAAASDREAHRARREGRIRLATLTGMLSRVVGLGMSFISVPLTVRYLSSERYGVWLTIGSFVTWLSLADLGISNGLVTRVADALGRGDETEARRVISTALSLLLGMLGLVVAVVVVGAPFVPWRTVLGASQRIDTAELHGAVAVALAGFLVALPLGVIDRLWGALQEAHVGAMFGLVGNTLGTAALIAVALNEGNLVWLAVALSLVPVVLRLLSGVYLLLFRHPELRPRRSDVEAGLRHALLRSGGALFVTQLSGLAVWQTDNIIIATVHGAESVASYGIATRLVTTYVGLLSLWIGPLWPAVADAASRNDFPWVRAALRKIGARSVALTVCASAGLVLLGRQIIEIWAGPTAVPSLEVLVALAAYMPVLVACTVASTVLMGLNRVGGMMLYGLASAVVNLVLGIWWVHSVGVHGVPLATAVAALVPALLAMWEVRRELEQRERAAR